MDIVFSTNNNFCCHAAVAIVSLLNKNKDEKIAIHLFSIDVETENIEKLCKTIAQFENAVIKVYKISKDLFKDFPNPGYYSFATYLRLLTPSLLPETSKVLYLDCDLIVNGSLKELWETDIQEYSCAGVYDSILSFPIVRDYIHYDYFWEGYANAGVLLINLDYWRKHLIQEKLINFLNSHDVRLNDQDAINIVLHGTMLFLHPKWNTQSGYFAFPPLVRREHKMFIKELWRDAKIVHFTGPVKPWHKECVNPYKKVYIKCKQQTPWKNIKLSHIEKNLMRSLSIIFLRTCKNVVARTLSYTYR